MKIAFLFSLVFCYSFYSFSQNPECWYQFSNGNVVHGMAEDGDFIWLSLDNGLAKLEIESFEIMELYNAGNSEFPTYDPRQIAIDENGDLWVGIQYVGVGKLSNGQWTIFNKNNSPLIGNGTVGPRVTEIFVDSENDIWIGTQVNGLYKFDGNLWSHFNTNNSPLVSNGINAIIEDSSQQLWIGTGQTWTEPASLVKYDKTGNWELFDTNNSGLPSNKIYDLAIDSLDNLWIGTDEGLTFYDGATWQNYLPGEYINSLELINNQLIFIGSRFNPIYIFDLISGWEELPTPDGRSADELLFDRKGNLWVDTGWGLFQFNHNSEWKEMTPLVTGLETTPVFSFLKDNNGHYWMGTSIFGLYEFDGQGWTYYDTIAGGLGDFRITELAELNDKVILGKNWGTHGTVTEFDGVNEKTIADGIGTIYDFEQHQDTLWVGAAKGLFKYDGIVWENVLDANDTLPFTLIFGIEFFNQNLWVTTFGHGLAKFDYHQWTIWDTLNSNIPNNFAQELSIDDDGNPWFFTDSPGDRKLIKFDGDEFLEFADTFQALQSGYIYDLEVADENNIYIGNGRGLIYNADGNWKLRKSREIFDVYRDGGKYLFGGFIGMLIRDPGCSFDDPINKIEPTKINDHLLKIFPNPNAGNLHFKWSLNPAIERAGLSIFSLDGKMIFERIINFQNDRTTVQLPPINNGIYLCRVKNRDFNFCKKIIIQKN